MIHRENLDSIENREPQENRAVLNLKKQLEDSTNRVRTLELELMQEKE